jgi:hypothetical protein
LKFIPNGLINVIQRFPANLKNSEMRISRGQIQPTGKAKTPRKLILLKVF